MELDDLVERVNDTIVSEDMEYFYHITSLKSAESICESGLLMSENRLSSTTIPLPEEFFDDVNTFIEGEYSSSDRRPQEAMVLLCCGREEVKDLIRKNLVHNEAWSEQDPDKYVIDSANVVGYIDMLEKRFEANPNTEFALDSSFKF